MAKEKVKSTEFEIFLALSSILSPQVKVLEGNLQASFLSSLTKR
jgi:hypothetical protein